MPRKESSGKELMRAKRKESSWESSGKELLRAKRKESSWES